MKSKPCGMNKVRGWLGWGCAGGEMEERSVGAGGAAEVMNHIVARGADGGGKWTTEICCSMQAGWAVASKEGAREVSRG